MLSQIYKFIVDEIKNMYGRFWATTHGNSEYYLKLEGYYFCKKRQCTIVVIQVRHKRTVEKIPVSEVITDSNLVKELHPVDACVVGILANNERNGLIDKSCEGWQKIKRFRYHRCFVKSEPILQISKKYLDCNGKEITVLNAKYLDQEITIPTIELSKNQALLYALDSFQAISVGYDASEFYLRENLLR